MTTIPEALPPSAATTRSLGVELLVLDLTSCTRCVGTLANIETAIAAVRQVVELTGTSIRVQKIVIESEEEARRHGFVSSPTIRIAGRDIVFDTLESPCESCTDVCGCSEGTNCRLWRYRGADYTEAPVGLIVEALLRELAPPRPEVGSAGAAATYEVPANLRAFFAGKDTRLTAAANDCCSAVDQATCCEPAEKSSCCEGPEPSTCGCR
jgi:Domain of unknown function (DUF2703)